MDLLVKSNERAHYIIEGFFFFGKILSFFGIIPYQWVF